MGDVSLIHNCSLHHGLRLGSHLLLHWRCYWTSKLLSSPDTDSVCAQYSYKKRKGKKKKKRVGTFTWFRGPAYPMGFGVEWREYFLILNESKIVAEDSFLHGLWALMVGPRLVEL